MSRNHKGRNEVTDQIVRFDLRLPQSLLDRIEAVAETEHRSTSAQMRLAISQHIERAEGVAA